MTSYLPQWITDLATILTIVGFALTVWLLIEARDLKNSFVRRARLPEIIRELQSISKSISNHLKNWPTEKNEAIRQLSIGKVLIESLCTKLPDNERNKCKNFLKKMSTTRLFFIRNSLSEIDQDKAWELYTILSEITTMLIEFQKDSKWN